MPNGNDYGREYGPHKYPGRDGTVDCAFGCGCSIGDSMSHGPTGLDPAPYAECPGNPKDGNLAGGKADYDIVVTRRIRGLERRAYQAEEALKKVSPSKKKLAEELGTTKQKLFEAEQALETIRKAAATVKK